MEYRMSRLVVDRLQGNAATGNKITVPSGHTLIAPGHVLQVQSRIFTDQLSTTSTSYTDAFSVTFTPKANNSKFSVDAVIVFSDNGRGYNTNNTEARFKLYNSYTATNVSPAVNTGSYTTGVEFWGWDAELGYQFSDEQNAYLIKNIKWIGEFTGSTAGTPITLTLQWKTGSGNSIFLNRVYQAAASGAGVSALRVMEIAQ